MTCTRLVRLFALIGLIGVLWAQSAGPSLKGVVTDPSGATVQNALVQLRGPGGEQRATTDIAGRYSFSTLRPGKYLVRVIAKGFTVNQSRDYQIMGPMTLDVQLTIEAQSQVINVEDEAAKVTMDPDSNASALVIGEKELAALSDDPDELEQQLQAMAGPSAGPNGGQIYIDGFSGGTMPPKSSIREVRINSNPYSTEYDRPGFGRIEILTKPGTDNIRGQAFVQYNNQNFNSRSPLLTQSDRPPYSQKFFGFHLSGPVKKGKSSFGLDMERRMIDENAFILATTLDSQFNPVTVNKVLLTPQTRTTISPRFDLALNAKHTLVARYMEGRNSADNEGVGGFGLESKAYSRTNSDRTVQLTETAILSPRAINELRFQWHRTELSNTGDNTIPALGVQGAFDGGGAQIGLSGNTSRHWELNNSTTVTIRTHTMKWGGRLRGTNLDDTSMNNFGGTYTFFGGLGPVLDSSNQAIPGATEQLTALERYRRTLYFQSLGYSPDLIRTLGGGASQFSLGAGTPLTPVSQVDAGLFFNDDWRIRPNITLSYGLRYETQNNIGDYSNWAPRVGLAWGIGGGANRRVKTVLRAGFGIFYDRIGENVTLQSLRYNGSTQLSYLVRNPDFFPVIPSIQSLESAKQPQQLQIKDAGLRAPRNYQASIGVERQLNKYTKLSVQYLTTRGVHLQRMRNINAPIDGVYPYGDAQLRLLTETTGFSRTSQLIISPNVNYKKMFLFGFYSYGHGKSDAEGMPANPYDLRSEWGPSGFGDIRHRVVVGTSIPMPWKVSLSPFMTAASGSPYNLTTGRDTNGDGFTNDRPELLGGVDASACQGGNLVFTPQFGCFNLSPAPGTAISRNFARGPATVTLNMRLSRSWGFGNRGESGTADGGGPPMGGGPGGPGGGGGGGGRGGPGGGGPPMMGGMGGGRGGPGGMFGASTGKKYSLTLSLMAQNILNHANYAAPSGDLSSPYFGESRSLAGGFGPMGGASTYNRKIDMQLRFTF